MRGLGKMVQRSVHFQGKTTYTFTLADGRKVKGASLIHNKARPWHQSLSVPSCRYARLRAKSVTYAEVPLILVDKPGEDRFYLFCVVSQVPATHLLLAWSRRHLKKSSAPSSICWPPTPAKFTVKMPIMGTSCCV